MALVSQIGAEGFVDTNEVDLLANWSGGSTNSSAVTISSLSGELNNQWFNVGASVAQFVSVSPSSLVDQGGGVREMEFTAAVFIPVATTLSANQQFMFCRSGSSSSSNPIVSLRNEFDAGSGDNDKLVAYVRTATGFTSFDLGITLVDNILLYVTIRMKSETSISGSDGTWEVWINGNLVGSDTGVNWASNDTATFTNISGVTGLVRGAGGGNIHTRNLMFYDGWTKAPLAAPDYKHVVDLIPTGVTATSYTNEGGAANTVEAVTDNLDTTYLETATASVTASMGFTVPVSLATFDIVDMETRLRVSRTTGSSNDIDIEVRNGAGSTVLDTVTHSIVSVDPGREAVQNVQNPASATNLNDVTVVVRNGA